MLMGELHLNMENRYNHARVSKRVSQIETIIKEAI